MVSSVCLCLNIQGMKPSPNSRSFWKLPKLKEEITFLNKKHLNVPFVAVAESWLKPEVTDVELTIPDYNIYRSDRIKSSRGGVILYVHQNIIIDNFSIFDDDVCQGVICLSSLSKCIIACVYRPPTASPSSFSSLLLFLNNFILQHNSSNTNTLLTFGDFNLPKLNVTSGILKSSLSTAPNYAQFLDFMSSNFLSQYVEENTRQNNVLDLFLTNCPNFTHLAKCEDILYSDHCLVKIYTNFFRSFKPALQQVTETQNCDDTDFSTLNLNTADFDAINHAFKSFDWDNMVSSLTVDEFPEEFKQIVFSIIKQNCSKLNTNPKSFTSSHKRKRKIISRKIRKLKKKLSKCLTIISQNSVKNKIKQLKEEQIQSYLSERNAQELIAVNKIKSDKKYFFKYANRLRKTLSSPSILLDTNNELVNDHKKIADLLQDQFVSVFSQPNLNFDSSSCSITPNIINPLPPFSITIEEVVTAINEIKSNSSCPRYAIPAKVLKDCKYTLSKPLKLFYEKSFLLGKVPDFYKFQQIIPLHKKGPKTNPANFRPISLTSHIIKIFERVLRAKLVNFFESNNIFNQNQHGFRKSRSCLTQLLTHVQNVLDHLLSNSSVDTIYIDYAKAFDKVDHHILMTKLKLYGLSNEYLLWIKDFLTGRRQAVFINGCYSYEAMVRSGVPQGSVLGPLLFIIFINDLSNHINYSSLLTFADDTKIVLPVSSALDTQLLQKDLDSIISWSNLNNMALNKSKFEFISHRKEGRFGQIGIHATRPLNGVITTVKIKIYSHFWRKSITSHQFGFHPSSMNLYRFQFVNSKCNY